VDRKGEKEEENLGEAAARLPGVLPTTIKRQSRKRRNRGPLGKQGQGREIGKPLSHSSNAG